MAPRRRIHSTDPLTRFRNQSDAQGRPAMGGKTRLGLNASKPLTENAARPAAVPPLIFHWPGTVEDHIDVRNGPGKFPRSGSINRIEYVWDTAPASGVTVAWHFDGSGTATWTHSLGTSDEQTESETTSYADQHIVAVVTAADATASGLTAFVHLD